MCTDMRKASVAVNECDEKKKGAEGDGARQHRFHQQSRPAAQEKHVNKQPRQRDRKSKCVPCLWNKHISKINQQKKTKQVCIGLKPAKKQEMF